VPTLRFHRGPDLVFEHRLKPGRTTIGRADTSDVALPDETISRTHCIVQGRRDDWTLVDRSRHGLRVDGARVDGRSPLVDGSVIDLGSWRVVVGLAEREAPPTAAAAPDQGHEIVHGVVEGRVVAERAVLVVADGPDAGRRVVLDRSRAGVGAPGSHVRLSDPGLVADHVFLRVARGRVMVEPGHGATFHDGVRVRDITPLHGDEDFRVGQTTLRVERRVTEEAPTAGGFGELVGAAASMQRLFGQLRRMAGHHYTVLVIGPSGTGKELIARGIHDHSARGEGPFIALNCGAISETLFESELFGHEKGAFTGADRRRDGAFQEADGGTLFLDEVGELPEAAQAKLLRALETGEVRRVGSARVSTPDVRIVAATNRDLPREVAAGRFREDLFFRLAVLTVEVPPLRERLDDLPALCAHLCHALDPSAHVTGEAMAVLRRHLWPGNVRELRNVLTRAYVLGGPRIGTEALSFHQIPTPAGPPVVADAAGGLDGQERAFIQAVLARHADNRSAAARELGIARSTLHYKMRRLGLT
jgi:two-component system, NtrC family, response regulator HydG